MEQGVVAEIGIYKSGSSAEFRDGSDGEEHFGCVCHYRGDEVAFSDAVFVEYFGEGVDLWITLSIWPLVNPS
jgi:hypothetical protein